MAIIEGAPTLGAGDIGELYGAFAARLEQIVRTDVRASNGVIEDACQVAWYRLLRHGDRVRRETVVAWLARTAIHEAFRSMRQHRRERPLEDGGGLAFSTAPATPPELFEQRARLREIQELPVRQQRLLWLRAFGLSYAEMAAHEQCTRRTVDRQLVRARAALRERSS